MLALVLVTVAVDNRQVLQVCLAFRYSALGTLGK